MLSVVAVDQIHKLHEEKVCQDDNYCCNLVGKDGLVSQSSYPTLRQLVMHQKMSAKHKGATIHLRQFVPTNQCVFCETVFASHMAAFNHVRNSMRHGRCIINKAFLCVPLKGKSWLRHTGSPEQSLRGKK